MVSLMYTAIHSSALRYLIEQLFPKKLFTGQSYQSTLSTYKLKQKNRDRHDIFSLSLKLPISAGCLLLTRK